MDISAYIESGILELYVAGALTESENIEVYNTLIKHPEILEEVLEIEAAVIRLTEGVSPGVNAGVWTQVKEKLVVSIPNAQNKPKVIKMVEPKYNWLTYLGWSAAILLGVGLFYTTNLIQGLQSDLQTVGIEKSNLEIQIEDANLNLEANQNLLSILRDKNIISVPLGGQGEFANTYAKVYWNKSTNQLLLDAQGLPAPPPGKVYQVWSLKLSPLTPTSLGTIDNFMQDENKIFELQNLNDSEAFGITLEPAGGSESPTMEQLYTLGAVAVES